ncbi:MAG: hypothetical protein MJZ65_01950 [Paludibacteraceae bacterium]|nr:hypothetical protein [Paludibacteraceae bacterium]
MMCLTATLWLNDEMMYPLSFVYLETNDIRTMDERYTEGEFWMQIGSLNGIDTHRLCYVDVMLQTGANRGNERLTMCKILYVI